MSAALQSLSHFEQPQVPPPSLAWPRGIWQGTQPTASKIAPCLETKYDQWIFEITEHRQGQDILRWRALVQSVPLGSATKDLEAAYVIQDRPAVTSFIEENGLRGILLQARDPLNAAFGNDAVKTLTLVRDDEGFEIMFCLVMVPGDMREARRALASFDQQWWLGHSSQAAGKLNFDFELV